MKENLQEGSFRIHLVVVRLNAMVDDGKGSTKIQNNLRSQWPWISRQMSFSGVGSKVPGSLDSSIDCTETIVRKSVKPGDKFHGNKMGCLVGTISVSTENIKEAAKPSISILWLLNKNRCNRHLQKRDVFSKISLATLFGTQDAYFPL